MSINSNKKGKAGELEFANLLKEYGYTEARRSQQYAGINNDADVVGLPGFHIEVKRVENLNIAKALEQALEDKAADEIAIVAHRKNRKEWKITLRHEDWEKVRKSPQAYLVELRTGKGIQIDSNLEKTAEKCKKIGYKPLLLHGEGLKDLMATIYLEDFIKEVQYE